MSDVGSVTVSNVASATVYSGIEGAVVASMSSRFCDDVQRNSMSFACVSALARSVDRPGHKAIASVSPPWLDPSIVQATRCGRTQ